MKRILFLASAAMLLSSLPIGAVAWVQAVAIAPPDAAKLIENWGKAQDAADKTAPLLDPSDQDALPNYHPPGMPEVPISCGSDLPDAQVSDCHQCYQEAHKKLQDLRRYFEQLRRVYVETDDFAKAQIAFGDGIAGSVGVGAIEWAHQRRRITQSFKQFQGAYKKKYEELLNRLDQVLHEIADCEREFFGDRDWYNRYGFIFQSFMALHYAR